MHNSFKFKSTALGVLARLVLMLVLGGVLVVIQAYLVKSGRLPVDLNLNAVIHFIVIATIGGFAGMISKERRIVNMLAAVALMYILLLFIGGVICDGLGQGSVLGFFGGLAGFGVTIFSSLAQDKKANGWKMKKRRC